MFNFHFLLFLCTFKLVDSIIFFNKKRSYHQLMIGPFYRCYTVKSISAKVSVTEILL